MARMMLAFLISLPVLAQAADETRLSFLEQEVRNLQRQVQALSRQVDQMGTRPDRPTTASASSPDTVRAGGIPSWASAAKWRQVRTGMSELQVIEVLGPPTSMRDENGARVLYYAMEIGESGFLGGSVALRDRAVSEVHPPTLQ